MNVFNKSIDFLFPPPLAYTILFIFLLFFLLKHPANFQENQKNKEANENGSPVNAEVSTTSTPNAANEKPSVELESKDKLLEAILTGLTQDKIIGMMNVRKGRVSSLTSEVLVCANFVNFPESNKPSPTPLGRQ